VGTLAHYGVARGYQDGSYQPTGTVLYAQTISFISRAMVAKQLWTARDDNPALYPNVPASSGHRADIATYVANAGRLPGSSSTGQQWPGWDQPSTRGWFAVALWQALNPSVGTPPIPATARLTVSPTSGPAGTVFTVSGTGFPAGATGTWGLTGNGATGSEAYQLEPTQTTFSFTLTSAGAPSGTYGVNFTANGWAAASANFGVSGTRPDNYALVVEYRDNCAGACSPGYAMWVNVYLTNNGVGVPGATMKTRWSINGYDPGFYGNPTCGSWPSDTAGYMSCSIPVPPVSYCGIWCNNVHVAIEVAYGSQKFTTVKFVAVDMIC